MFRTILGSDQLNSGKNGVKHRNQKNNRMSSFGLIEKNMELSHIYLALPVQQGINPYLPTVLLSIPFNK